MKQLLIFVFTIILFTRCNNNNGGWSAAERQKGLKACMDEVAGNLDDATSKKYCGCVIDKAMQKYKTFVEANNGTTEDGTKLGQECLKEINLGKNTGDDTKEKNGGGLFGGGINGGGNKKQTDDDGNGGAGGGNGWSLNDKNAFLGPCETGLTGQGYSSSKASALCSCVLEKLEKKYRSLSEGNQKGGEAAGSRAMQECLAGGNTDDN